MQYWHWNLNNKPKFIAILYCSIVNILIVCMCTCMRAHVCVCMRVCTYVLGPKNVYVVYLYFSSALLPLLIWGKVSKKSYYIYMLQCVSCDLLHTMTCTKWLWVFIFHSNCFLLYTQFEFSYDTHKCLGVSGQINEALCRYSSIYIRVLVTLFTKNGILAIVHSSTVML